MTPSATAALELAVMAMGWTYYEEVVMPSFGFSSIANAVILRGCVPIFVDIEPERLSMDAQQALEATKLLTRGYIPIHYAGVAAPYPFDGVIEDAAHCIGADWRITGEFAAISFHETKNVSCGQGGALIVRDAGMVDRIEVLRQCGTTKSLVAHAWDWVDVGTQQLMNDVTAELLYDRLLRADEIAERRLEAWGEYHALIHAPEMAHYPGNGHIFWFLHPERDRVQQALADKGVRLTSHYTPLHSRKPGMEYGRAFNDCPVSTRVAAQILRPPMNVTVDEARRIASLINEVL